jgi:hypothetical protein
MKSSDGAGVALRGGEGLEKSRDRLRVWGRFRSGSSISCRTKRWRRGSSERWLTYAGRRVSSSRISEQWRSDGSSCSQRVGRCSSSAWSAWDSARMKRATASRQRGWRGAFRHYSHYWRTASCRSARSPYSNHTSTPVTSNNCWRAFPGKSVRKAKEFLAARYPSADVPSTVRKLPERATSWETVASGQSARAMPLPAAGNTSNAMPPPDVANAANAAVPLSIADEPTPHEPPRNSRGPASLPPDRARADVFTPLSSERYAIRFTASKELKQKLELARDLLRHASPNGDFAPVIERALDLLLAELSRRRFGTVGSGSARRSSGAQHDRGSAGIIAEPLHRQGSPSRGRRA